MKAKVMEIVIPVEIYRDIENLADILGVSEQQLVRAALRLYFKPYKDQGEEIRNGWRD